MSYEPQVAIEEKTDLVFEIFWGLVLLGLLGWVISQSSLAKLWGGKFDVVEFHIALLFFFAVALMKTVGDDGGIGDI